MAELDDELWLVGKLAVPGKDDSSLSIESPDDVVGLEDVDGSLGGVTDHQDDHHTRQQGGHRTVPSGTVEVSRVEHFSRLFPQCSVVE